MARNIRKYCCWDGLRLMIPSCPIVRCDNPSYKNCGNAREDDVGICAKHVLASRYYPGLLEPTLAGC